MISFIDVQDTFRELFVYIYLVRSLLTHLIICQTNDFSRIYEKDLNYV